MKTTSPIKKTMQVIIVTGVIIASVLFTKNIINNIKYIYGLEPAGKAMSCFYDIIQ